MTDPITEYQSARAKRDAARITYASALTALIQAEHVCQQAEHAVAAKWWPPSAVQRPVRVPAR